MTQTYLTTQELSDRIRYEVRTIRNQLKDTVLIEGIHYILYHLSHWVSINNRIEIYQYFFRVNE
jgi:hypothetical protein